VSDDRLELDAAQRDALAAFERDASVFDELGEPRPDDAARIASWIDHAVAQSAGATAAATIASKPWLVGGAIALVAGGIAAALVAGRGPSEPTAPEPAPVEAPIEAAPIAASIEPAPIEAPAAPAPVEAQIEPAPIEAPTEPAPAIKKRTAKADAESPATLLRQATLARQCGEARAYDLYRRLVREFPRTREGGVARIAIGQFELASGHADKALAAFDAYLRQRSTGNLAEEAAFGRARALRALGRTAAERKAVQSFIERFPGSVQLEQARTRLAELGG
jgi:TolA-binding protein